MTPTLTKAELAEVLHERLGLNKRESKDMVEAFFEIVHATLVCGDDVKLPGLGSFNIRRKAARPGRNLRTGQAIPIKARHVVRFQASHKLKGIVQGADDAPQHLGAESRTPRENQPEISVDATPALIARRSTE